LSISTPKANVNRWAIRGQPQLGLRRFISATASMSSLFGPFRGRRMPALRRKQQAVFSLRQRAVEIEQRRGLQDHCTTQNAAWVHEKDAQTGDHTLGGAEVGSAIENQWLMFDEHRLGNDGTEASRSR
jgi:hypothetical protein